jgi:hypothetical protein
MCGGEGDKIILSQQPKYYLLICWKSKIKIRMGRFTTCRKEASTKISGSTAHTLYN